MDGSFVEYYNSLVSIYSDCKPSELADKTARFQKGITGLKNTFESRDLDMAHPCTASSDRQCWIFSHLTLWNQILNPIATQLIEDTPDHLSLCPLQIRFNEIFSQDLILQSCIAVHWLLKEHHCISTVDINDYDFVNNYTSLFCNALSVSKAVKKLVLSSYDFDDDYGDELAAAVGSMPCLEKLELNEVLLNDESLGLIGYNIGARNTLLWLHAWANDRWPESGAEFLDGAKSCTNLKFLNIGIMYLGMDGAGSLSDMLRNNPGLEKVKIEGVQFKNDELHIIAEGLSASPLLKLEKLEFTGCRLHASALAVLADALQQHRMLTSLRFIESDLDCSKVRALVRVLKDCVRLRELSFDSSYIRDGGAIALSKCLGAAKNLEVLSMKQNSMTSSGAITLIEALLQQTEKTHLHLGHIKANNNEALDLSRTLEVDGASDRVGITYNAAGIFQLGRVLRTNSYKVEEIVFDANFVLAPEHLKELFSALSYDCNVKRLCLGAGKFDDSSAQELCSLLSINKTLKYLELSMELQQSHMILLFEGLAKNASVSELVLHESRFDSDSVHAFVAMLKVNKALNKFSRCIGDPQSLRILGAGVSANYTLLDLGMRPECVDSVVVFDIEEVRRRNYETLNKAVKFALMVQTERGPAVAFEKVRFSDAFLPHLKAYGGLSEDNARNCVKVASRYIASWFLVLSGIVKEKLECHPTDCSVTQIDQLSVECLENIFSYLKLEDVVQVRK
ncbi:uncharacterized protein LOC135398832 [Ornithodoros turicata]|uniref:uncharacterized protein LOC135398832 n=1 Tax=Ornithodoros turicata TaxID=34597 RepID=UPI003139927F